MTAGGEKEVVLICGKMRIVSDIVGATSMTLVLNQARNRMKVYGENSLNDSSTHKLPIVMLTMTKTCRWNKSHVGQKMLRIQVWDLK